METTTHLTLEQYAAMDEDGDQYFTELVRGQVLREPRPGRRHGNVHVKLAYFLQRWALEHGAWVYAESGFILEDEPPTVRGPDVAVRLTAPSNQREIGGWIRGAPDVAVEVLSPSNTSSAMQDKVLQYLDSGARLVWIVDPAARTVTVYRADGSVALLKRDDTLIGEDVLEGFAVGLENVFGA